MIDDMVAHLCMVRVVCIAWYRGSVERWTTGAFGVKIDKNVVFGESSTAFPPDDRALLTVS